MWYGYGGDNFHFWVALNYAYTHTILKAFFLYGHDFWWWPSAAAEFAQFVISNISTSSSEKSVLRKIDPQWSIFSMK